MSTRADKATIRKKPPASTKAPRQERREQEHPRLRQELKADLTYYEYMSLLAHGSELSLLMTELRAHPEMVFTYGELLLQAIRARGLYRRIPMRIMGAFREPPQPLMQERLEQYLGMLERQ